MIIWDPSRIAFHLPVVNHPVAWYGVCFALGFLLAYFFLRWEFFAYTKDKVLGLQLADRLLLLVIIATVVGARLGEVFFYEWPYYSRHPWKILAVWEGGLASHGGILAIFGAIWIHARVSHLRYLVVLDLMVTPCSLAAGFIRLGNFINQEIVGTVTQLPWGIVFGQISPQPLHPAQLYEALLYFALFFGLWRVQKYTRMGAGVLSGLFFLIGFSGRFLIEFIKVPQGQVLTPYITMGQWLSLPLIVLGAALLYRGWYNKGYGR